METKYFNKIQLNPIIFNYLKFSTILLPPMMVTGSFLPDLLVSLNSLIFICYIFLNKIDFLFKNIFFKYFVVFYFIINLSSFFSVDILFSLKSSIPYFRFIFLAFTIYYLCQNDSYFKKYFFLSLISTYGVLIFDGFLQYFSGKNLQGYPISPSSRLGGLFGDEKILGSFLSRHFPLLIFFIFNLNLFNSKYRILILAILILAQILIFLSGERSAFIINLLTIFYLILMIKKVRLIGYFFLIVSLIIILSQLLLNQGIKKRMINLTLDGFSSSIYFSKIHEKFYFTAIDSFKKNPLLGSGPNTFRITCKVSEYKDSECSTHPHNTYIQLLSETGILGFSLILFVFLFFFYLSIKHYFYSFKDKNVLSDSRVCLIACFLITLFPISTSGNFFNNFLSINYFLPVGFYLSMKNNL